MCVHVHTHTLISLSHEILHWGHHSFMFYSESQYPDLTLILITHRCDVVSAKGTLNEGFIVAHGLNVQSIVEGEPWKQECEVLMAWQSADGREWSTALPWLFSFYFISSCSHGQSCPHSGRVSPPHLHLCRNNPLDTHVCSHRGSKFFQVCDEKPINLFTYMFLTSCLPFMSKFLKSTSQVLL